MEDAMTKYKALRILRLLKETHPELRKCVKLGEKPVDVLYLSTPEWRRPTDRWQITLNFQPKDQFDMALAKECSDAVSAIIQLLPKDA